MRARVLLVWIFGAILMTPGHRTRSIVNNIRRLVHKHPKMHPMDELTTRKSMLFDVVNKQDLQTGIYDSMGRVPWKSYNNGKEKGPEDNQQLSPEEMTELFKKLYNDVKINGREISTLKPQSVIQTDSRRLSSIEPLSETDEVVHINDKSGNMKALPVNFAPLQPVKPRTSSLPYADPSVGSPIDSHTSSNSPLGTLSILQMNEGADNPMKSFQEVDETMKTDKNKNPIAVPLPLGHMMRDAQQQSLEQKTNVQDDTDINQQALTPKIMEFQSLSNTYPNGILRNEPEKAIDINQQALMQQTTEQTPSLVNSLNPNLVENELGNNVNINQQELYPVQDQLLSATGNTGAVKEVLQGVGTLQDSAVPGGQMMSQDGQGSRSAEFLLSEGDGTNRAVSSSLDWAANTGQTQNALKNVFSAINGVKQLGSFSDIVVNPYSRDSLYKGGHHSQKPDHKKVDMSHFPNHSRENGKTKGKQRHEARTHKNSTQKIPSPT